MGCTVDRRIADFMVLNGQDLGAQGTDVLKVSFHSNLSSDLKNNLILVFHVTHLSLQKGLELARIARSSRLELNKRLVSISHMFGNYR